MGLALEAGILADLLEHDPEDAGELHGLLAECEQLASRLGIPAELTPDSDALRDAADDPGLGGARWQRYGIESYGCVVLAEGCRRSIATGAALVLT